MPFGRCPGALRVVWLTSRTGAHKGLAIILNGFDHLFSTYCSFTIASALRAAQIKAPKFGWITSSTDVFQGEE